MICPVCGESLPDKAVYCGYCGRKLPDGSLTPPKLSQRILGVFAAGVLLLFAGILIVWSDAADPVTMMVRAAPIQEMGSKHLSRVVETAIRVPRWSYLPEGTGRYLVSIEGEVAGTNSRIVLGLLFVLEENNLLVDFIEIDGRLLSREEAVQYINKMYENAAEF